MTVAGGWVVAALVAGALLGPLLDAVARRCLSAESWRSHGVLTGLVAGGVGAAVVALAPVARLAPAWWALAIVGTVIVRTDLVAHRIPDILTITAFACGAVLLAIPWDGSAYARAWLGALALSAVFLGLGLLGPTGLGMGDVKLAPTLGLYLAYLGWTELLVGVAAGFMAAALVGVVVVLRDALRRRPLRGALQRAVPFGPFLLLGAVVGLAVS